MEKNNPATKINSSDLYIELSSIENAIYNLRNKIACIERRKNTEIFTVDNSDDIVEVLGRRLKEERELRGYKLYHAARKSGLRYETVQSLEEGKGSIKNFIKYGLSLGMFFCFLPTTKY